MMKFKVGDVVVRATDEAEKDYCGGRAPSLENSPIGTVATVLGLIDDYLFEMGDRNYYMLYGDWEFADFSLENE